jgi:hypothetical protein
MLSWRLALSAPAGSRLETSHEKSLLVITMLAASGAACAQTVSAAQKDQQSRPPASTDSSQLSEIHRDLSAMKQEGTVTLSKVA